MADRRIQRGQRLGPAEGLTLADAKDIVATHARRIEEAAEDAFHSGPAELHCAAELSWQRLVDASGRCKDPASNVLARAAYLAALIAAATHPDSAWPNDPAVWNGCHLVAMEIRRVSDEAYTAEEVDHA